MEAYPIEYITHNLPLIALSGLGGALDGPDDHRADGKHGHGVKVSADLPPLEDVKATAIREEFLKADGASLPWNGVGHPDRPDVIGYAMRCVDRVSI